VRAKGDPRAVLGSVRSALHDLDPRLPLLEVRTLAQHIDANLVTQRVPAQMLAVLAPLALGLAAIGLYAVIAYSLAQRTKEIGVRLALGSSLHAVVSLMVWQGMRVVLVGAAVGWPVALFAGWTLRRTFVGVPFGDPLIYAGVPALLVAVALLACFLPARRAANVDPLTALRAE
jgi:ABC-type lipoprotein release transport system permease subunit